MELVVEMKIINDIKRKNINLSDKIMYLERGKIIAEGTHEELLKKSNEYRILYEEEKRK